MQVMYDKEKQKVPVKIWSKMEEVEPQALDQLRNIAAMPFMHKHVAAMPDVHLGLGATVGSVIATDKAIIPAAVGVDIGCGMMAVKTPLHAGKVQDKIKEIRHSIERSIPVGFGENKNLTAAVETWEGWANPKLKDLDPKTYAKARNQLGSLGGGNHFVEICVDTEGAVWVMLHSGSRGIGNITARGHIEKAKGIMKQYMISLPDPDLAYFVEETPQFSDYIYDLHWCQAYAFQNRIEMMARVMKDLAYAVNDREPVPRLMEVNCHHNYTEKEHHYGKNVWVTRKGAVRARTDDFGIIPGSMGTRSYIVKGLGNEEAFCSCSHGAGRRMSRTAAKKQFSLEDLAAQTAGVECRKDDGVLDEIPGAYKDIDQVMENQKDLVTVVAQLKQIMCIKG